MRKVRTFLPFALLASIPFLSACSDSDGPTRPSGDLQRRITLRAGESVALGPEGILVGFREITQDSRCPINALCVWIGEARGSFFLAVGRTDPKVFELSTLEPRTAEISGYRVTLDSVLPAPAGNPIPPGDYVAALVISR